MAPVAPVYAAAPQIHPGGGDRSPFTVRGDIQGRAVKETDPIEIFGGQISDIGTELGELRVVKAAVGIGLGHVLREHRQLAHAVQRLAYLLQEAILSMSERHCVAQIGLGGGHPVDLCVETHRDRESGSVILRRYEPGTR